MAACDSNYCFTLLDIGSPGRNADSGVFSSSAFGQAIEGNSLRLPNPASPPRSVKDLPFIFVADEAFPLQPHIMRPYPGRQIPENQVIFNYRLSRARRTIENAFGILSARWRVFRRPIIAKTSKVVSVVKAACALHNWLKMADQQKPSESRHYCPLDFSDMEQGDGTTAPGRWRHEANVSDGLAPIIQVGSNNYSATSSSVRDAYCQYFISEVGAVPWQYNHVKRGSAP